MLSVYVLRLVTPEQANGRLVGEIEDVQSASTVKVRSAEELVCFLTQRREEEADER